MDTGLPLSDALSRSFPLRKSRAHEVCGASANSFAAAVCGVTDGPVLWITPAHRRERPHPEGLAVYCDPGRLVFATGRTHADLLWLAEESLRSGAAPVVVVHVEQPIDLTAGRRLQLAAEAGKSLGLFVIPDGAGSNAAETRWRCMPVFDAGDSTLQRWELIKNKSGTVNEWIIRWDEPTHRIIVVSKAGEQSGLARAPD